MLETIGAQVILNVFFTVVSAAAAVGGFVVASVRRELEHIKNDHNKYTEHAHKLIVKNQDDINAIALALAGEYATREDILRLHKKLDRIFDKLDEVPCKNGHK